MKRREFIAGFGGAAAWSQVAQAQRPQRMQRIGVLMSQPAGDEFAQIYLSSFAQALQELGWTIGRNVRVDYRWAAGDADLIRKYAAELVALAPDVILANTAPIVTALNQASSAVPVVFVTTIDPVGGGLVESLARPGGNATGFAAYEFSMGGKWMELLKEITPGVKRVAIIRNPSGPAEVALFAVIQAATASLGVELTPIGVRDAAEIERGITDFARGPNRGLITATAASVRQHRGLIIALAARNRLPAVYIAREFVAAGGLISYGIDYIEQYRQGAGYVDRILKGEKPADLPVQAPSKYELVINLKTAKALGLTIPETLLATADEVIQ
jgi:putative tryptophan/tyrosine transport system substrate-binding protein